jgi:hypothetical protein
MRDVHTKRLSDSEFKATFRHDMLDITGKEDEHEPRWVPDLTPYLEAIPNEELAQHPLLDGVPPAAVRRNLQDGYDHVLYPVRQDNTYLVVVTRFSEGSIVGHYILDLRHLKTAPKVQC